MPDDALVKNRRAKLKRPRPAGRTPVDTLRHHELRRLANLASVTFDLAPEGRK
jgi:hypothetical protein